MESILKNIGGINVSDDKYYRYKRSVVNISYKNSHGGQTVIDNLDKISHEIQTKPGNIVKYLKKNLNVNINDNVINATITKEKLETAIDNFIEKFILCPNCKLPEYQANLCSACGFTPSKQIESIEKRDLNNYIKDIGQIQDISSRTAFCTTKTEEEKFQEHFDKCLEDPKNIKKTYIGRELQWFEQKLTKQMALLYKSTKIEKDFLLDCAWQITEFDSAYNQHYYDRFIKEIVFFYYLVDLWLKNDKYTQNLIHELYICSSNDVNPPDWVKNDTNTKIIKILYKRHLKIQDNWNFKHFATLEKIFFTSYYYILYYMVKV